MTVKLTELCKRQEIPLYLACQVSSHVIVHVRGRVRITVVYRQLPVVGPSYSGKCSTETASTAESVMSPARTKCVSRVTAVVGGLLLHAFMVDQGETQSDSFTARRRRRRWGFRVLNSTILVDGALDGKNTNILGAILGFW